MSSSCADIEPPSTSSAPAGDDGTSSPLYGRTTSEIEPGEPALEPVDRTAGLVLDDEQSAHSTGSIRSRS